MILTIYKYKKLEFQANLLDLKVISILFLNKSSLKQNKYNYKFYVRLI